MRTKRMVAWLTSAVMVCALCLTLLPGTAFAAENYTMDFSQDVAVSWGPFTNHNFSTTDASGTGWGWNAARKTLTLTNFHFETDDNIAIQLPVGATLTLTAGTTNTVTANNTVDEYVSYGIDCPGGGTVTVNGGGALTATGGNNAVQQLRSMGVSSFYGLTVSDGSKLTGVGRSAATNNNGAVSSGIEAKILTVTDTSEVSGQSGSADNSFAITVESFTVSDSAKLTGIAGAGSVNSYGIHATSSGTINGGTVIASAPAGNAPVKCAFFAQPTIAGSYTPYYWRINDTIAYTENSVQPFAGSDAYWYVEIRPDLPGPGPGPGPVPGGDGTGGAEIYGDVGPDVPKTGDNTPLALFGALMLLCGAGLAMRRTRRKKEI